MKSRAPQLHLEYRFYKQLGHAGRIGFCVRWLENGRFTFCQRSLFDSSKNCQLPIWFSNMGHAKYGCQADSAVEPTCAPTMWRSATVCQALAVHGGGVPTPLCWRQQLRYFDRQHRRPAKSNIFAHEIVSFHQPTLYWRCLCRGGTPHLDSRRWWYDSSAQVGSVGSDCMLHVTCPVS